MPPRVTTAAATAAPPAATPPPAAAPPTTLPPPPPPPPVVRCIRYVSVFPPTPPAASAHAALNAAFASRYLHEPGFNVVPHLVDKVRHELATTEDERLQCSNEAKDVHVEAYLAAVRASSAVARLTGGGGGGSAPARGAAPARGSASAATAAATAGPTAAATAGTAPAGPAAATVESWLPYHDSANHKALLRWGGGSGGPPAWALVKDGCDACAKLATLASASGGRIKLRKVPRRAAADEPHHQVRFSVPALPGEPAAPPLTRLGVPAAGCDFVLTPAQARRCLAQPKRRRALPHQAAALRLMALPTPPRVVWLTWALGAGKTDGALRLVAAAPPTARPLLVVACPNTLVGYWHEYVTRHASAPAGGRPTDVHVVGLTELERRLAQDPHALRGATLILDEAHALRNLTAPMRFMLSCFAHAERVLLLTGTPLQNDPSEVWGVLALCGLRPPHTAGLDGEALPTPAGLQRELQAAWPRVAVMHHDPRTEPAMAHRYPTVACSLVRVPMTWSDALEYAMRERKHVTFGGVTISTAVTNAYRVGTRVACNTDAKLAAVVHQVVTLAGAAPGARQVVHSAFLESGVTKLLAALGAARVRGVPLRVAAITGATPTEERAAVVSAYNRGESDVLLISLAASEGIDLKMTAAIHLVEPANNLQAEAQTIARVARMDSHAAAAVAAAAE